MGELISVIVPIYRVENYLAQCIESIVNQTYRNLEIILVDDGSDDRCGEICDLYAERDSRIKVIHKKNGGADDARKVGIQKAAGTYVGYVDGDDWIEPKMYERLMYYIEKYHVDVVESGVIDSWETEKKMRVPFLEEGVFKGERFSKMIAPKVIYSGNFFQHGISPYLVTKLFRKDKIFKYQMMPEPSNNIVDDAMCTFPCIIESRSLYITHECYYHYRVRENSAKRLIRKDIAPTVMKYYKDWVTRCTVRKFNDNIENQVQYFVLYLLIAKAVYVFDNPQSEFYLSPFGKIRKSDRLIVYGAGTVGIHLKHYIEEVPGVRPVYWVDRNYKQLGKSLDVHDPINLKELEYDYIIVAILSASAATSARKDLEAQGIPNEKILWIESRYIDTPDILLKKACCNGKKLFEIGKEA